MKIIAYNVILSGAHRMATAGSPAEGKRADALNRDQWKKFFDSDGRLVNEIEMRKAMFEGYLYSIDTRNYCRAFQHDVFTWCSILLMTMNPSKCELLCISNKSSPV